MKTELEKQKIKDDQNRRSLEAKALLSDLVNKGRMSYEEIAVRIGVSYWTIHFWKTGYRRPHQSLLNVLKKLHQEFLNA